MGSSLTNYLYHIIYGTKHREPLIQPQYKQDLYAYTGGIIRSLGGTLLKINGMADHVHLVLKVPAALDRADVVKTVKAKSSKWMNEKPEYPGAFYWQRGYAGFSVSASVLPQLLAYVENQEEHHRVVSFEQEYCKYLRRFAASGEGGLTVTRPGVGNPRLYSCAASRLKVDE